MFPNLNIEYFFNLIYRAFVEREWLTILEAVNAVWRVMALIVSPIALVGIVYYTYQIAKIRRQEREELALAPALASAGATEPPVTNQRWQKIQAALSTEDMGAWRLAIIEADNILAEMVKAMHYPGESLGEQLKSIEPSDFTTLNDAWEAHKVRNRIVHEPNATLSRRELEETLRCYQRVFEEFNYL